MRARRKTPFQIQMEEAGKQREAKIYQQRKAKAKPPDPDEPLRVVNRNLSKIATQKGRESRGGQPGKPVQPAPRNRQEKKEWGKCNARTVAGGKCRRPAGAGTEHLGHGACDKHGGQVATHAANAATRQAIEFMGAPKDINPLDALIWCIKLTAGEVEFCNDQMAALEQDDWLESTLIGKQLHIWARERQKAVDRLVHYSATAIKLGIAERAIKLAEAYGASIAAFARGLLTDLSLTPEQEKAAPALVRKHLMLLETKAPVTDEDRADPTRSARRALTSGDAA